MSDWEPPTYYRAAVEYDATRGISVAKCDHWGSENSPARPSSFRVERVMKGSRSDVLVRLAWACAESPVWSKNLHAVTRALDTLAEVESMTEIEIRCDDAD